MDIEHLKEKSKRFGGIPFWSWNDKLEKDELIKQIKNMNEIGLKGFFMHARGGLLTEYCSDEWYDCINTCVNEAKKLNMQAWAYDENGWPSGFAGGKLLNDKSNLAAFLTAETGAFDENAFAVYDLNGKRITKASGECLNVYRDYINSYVDVMDKNTVRKFIEATHEEYKARVGDEFGKTMPGFFTDEPQYYRYHTAWSDTFLKNFEEEYGYSVFDALPALFIDFEGAKEKRYDYWLLCHKQYTSAFAEQIYNWCDKNGVMLTGHTIEEANLWWQMICCGGVMPFYEFEHIPGIDHLCRSMGGDLPPKQVTSVATQLNKPRVLTESFAACGWDVSPNELKKLTDWQLVCGINLLCTHLYPYSERGERKYDYPAHYSAHLPWQKQFAKFNRYFANVGAALSEGRDNSNVLILHPMHSAYLYFKREDDSALDELQIPFAELLKKYADNGVQYHLGDETIIARHGRVENGRFRIGACTYDFVVIPETETIDSTTAALLKEYLAQGGKLLLEGDTPTRIDGKISDISFLKSNTTYNKILGARQLVACGNLLRTAVRNGENGKIYYITNLNDAPLKNLRIVFKNCRGLKQLDLITLKEFRVPYTVNGNKVLLNLDLNVAESRLFIEDDAPPCKAEKKYRPAGKISANDFKLNKFPENCIALDFAELSLDGKSFEPKRYIKHIHELLIKRRHEGKTFLKFTFNLGVVPSKLSVCTEPLKNSKITVNGALVLPNAQSRLDKSFKLANIVNYCKCGENEIIIEFDYYQSQRVYDVLFSGVMESMRNSLTLDTEIEAIYLFGSFGVKAQFTDGENGCSLTNGDFTLAEQTITIDAADIVTDKYPFFYGTVDMQKKFTVSEAGIYRFLIDGRFASCTVYIDGAKVKELMFDRFVDCRLKSGTHTIRLVMTNSMRNIFGPLHHKTDELTVVTPAHFTFEGQWSETEEARDFKSRYSFMRFGIDDIKIKKQAF